MNLTMPEEIGLLALDDDKGTFAYGTDYGVGGAALVELITRGKLALVEDRAHVADPTPTGEPLLDGVLARIADSKKPRGLQYWIGVMSHMGSTIRGPLVDSLSAKGLVRRQEGKVLWIFDVERYPEADGRAECDIVSRIREVIIEGKTPDARTATLISLAKPTGLLSAALSKEEMKYGKDRIEQVRNAEPIGDEIADAIEACQAAVAAAVMVSTTSVTT